MKTTKQNPLPFTQKLISERVLSVLKSKLWNICLRKLLVCVNVHDFIILHLNSNKVAAKEIGTYYFLKFSTTLLIIEGRIINNVC